SHPPRFFNSPAIISPPASLSYSFFFFNHPAPPEISTLSLHDALPICWSLRPCATRRKRPHHRRPSRSEFPHSRAREGRRWCGRRSEEHTSELQSLTNLVCRLLLEKKKKKIIKKYTIDSCPRQYIYILY